MKKRCDCHLVPITGANHEIFNVISAVFFEFHFMAIFKLTILPFETYGILFEFCRSVQISFFVLIII